MKVNDSLYKCEWCDEKIPRFVINKKPLKYNVANRINGAGRHSTVDQITCPKCSRYVSQKTKLEIESK